MLYLTNFRERDIKFVVPCLRAVDRFEAHARTPHVSLESQVDTAIMHSMTCGTVFTIRLGSLPVGIGGICLSPAGHCPWLVGTDLLTAHAREFLRGSREVWDNLTQPFDVGEKFFNYVWEHNTLHRRWLAWLGFQVTGSYTTPAGITFKEYTHVLGSRPRSRGRAESRRDSCLDGGGRHAVRGTESGSE
jgi:hypothetical protein